MQEKTKIQILGLNRYIATVYWRFTPEAQPQPYVTIGPYKYRTLAMVKGEMQANKIRRQRGGWTTFEIVTI